MPTDQIRVRAHAKLNLNLRVLGLREDGYHDLRTVFQALALHDTLTFVSRPGPFSLAVSDSSVPADPSNLVWRAAELLWQHLGREGEVRDVSVHIDKRIPAKAGLGGGSADAAAALVGLARLWQPDFPPARLMAAGSRLGADVPFFFTGGAALGLGRGDELYPLADLPRLGVLLVVPPFDVPTPDAYRWIDDDRKHGKSLPVEATAADTIPRCPWPAPASEIVNDFQAVVAMRHPEVNEIVEGLKAAGAAAAALTGSGSAVFGLFEEDEALAGAAAAFRGSERRVWRTRTLPRREYLRASTPY